MGYYHKIVNLFLTLKRLIYSKYQMMWSHNTDTLTWYTVKLLYPSQKLQTSESLKELKHDNNKTPKNQGHSPQFPPQALC